MNKHAGGGGGGGVQINLKKTIRSVSGNEFQTGLHLFDEVSGNAARF